jgi:CRP-like cAMP-binding protein
MDAEERAALLGDTNLFRSLDRESLRNLGERATDRKFEAGSALYQWGDSANELFVVAKGHVALADRAEVVVANPGPKEFFGEAALYDEGPRMVSARAAQDAEVVLVRAEHFKEVVRRNPDVAEALLKHMAGVIRRSTER